MNYKKELELYRASKDRFMKTEHQSPLHYHEKIQEAFSHLDYYPIDERWKFNLELQKYDKIESIVMEMSTGGAQEYHRIGYLEFLHPDLEENVKINVYESEGHVTIMFRDKTSGEDTYGAGRYMDLKEEHGKMILDFNLAYNPFCAYSENYTCPLPPFENWLQVPITAGEKNFPLGH